MLPSEFYDEDGKKLFERTDIPTVTDLFGDADDDED